jgi:Bacterial regulatory proteins, gntR family
MNTMSEGVLRRTCMRDRIRDVLVGRILDGTYPAGTQLKELILAREFNVSQTPIREALRELEGSGLVTSERFRGTRVRGADWAEMREFVRRSWARHTRTNCSPTWRNTWLRWRLLLRRMIPSATSTTPCVSTAAWSREVAIGPSSMSGIRCCGIFVGASPCAGWLSGAVGSIFWLGRIVSC